MCGARLSGHGHAVEPEDPDDEYLAAVSVAPRLRQPWVALLLALLALGAAGLRLADHNWDQDQHLHPDEVALVSAAQDRVQWPPGTALSVLFDPAHSPLNPRAGGAGFPYGA